MKTQRRYASLEDRLQRCSHLSDVHYENEPCWIWTGNTRLNRTGKPYGYFNVRQGRRVVHVMVHRAVIKDIKGYRITRRSVVLHLCNNSLCCNPAHLMGGSQKMNMQHAITGIAPK